MSGSKLKLYLETTVFNYYFDDREGHDDVVELFERIKAGEFEAYTSGFVLRELANAQEPKRSKMLAMQGMYGIMRLEAVDDIEHLADEYVSRGVIPRRNRFDALHIASAAFHGLDAIVSYNFRHINRDKTRSLTDVIHEERGYAHIKICDAKEVLDHETL